MKDHKNVLNKYKHRTSGTDECLVLDVLKLHLI